MYTVLTLQRHMCLTASTMAVKCCFKVNSQARPTFLLKQIWLVRLCSKFQLSLYSTVASDFACDQATKTMVMMSTFLNRSPIPLVNNTITPPIYPTPNLFSDLNIHRTVNAPSNSCTNQKAGLLTKQNLGGEWSRTFLQQATGRESGYQATSFC